MKSINRRNFLRHSGLGLAAAALAPHWLSCSSTEDVTGSPFKNIGIQLFTLRDLLDKDAKDTLENVAKVGYKHVETFGVNTGNSSFWGIPVADLVNILKDNNLKTHSGHYDLSNYLTKGSTQPEDINKYIEIAHTLGQEYIVAPVPPMNDLNKLTASDYQFFAEQLNAAGELSKKAGIKMAYHNHFWEFRPFGNGTKGLDILIAFTDPELVDFELDLYWAVKAGEKPQTYFEKYPNRFPMWHIKDMDRSFSEPLVTPEVNPRTGKREPMDLGEVFKQIKYAEVGSGSIDFANIIRFDEQSGLKYAFVEQDEIYMPNKFESIKKSYDYVQRNLAKS
ncbi:sugar phosphate isomerase/epimerase family protein [Sphingobacterium chungjuense]|uniref:sugar phosphate isomerase/epimerase family protein n=1 Tax=Sphingobacterium chungjuense TaxID=2675553 RepID=UPI00140B47DF|nr:sugar phosphate isomerase/epimerase [Sphingobacterium chungjuense]